MHRVQPKSSGFKHLTEVGCACTRFVVRRVRLSKLGGAPKSGITNSPQGLCHGARKCETCPKSSRNTPRTHQTPTQPLQSSAEAQKPSLAPRVPPTTTWVNLAPHSPRNRQKSPKRAKTGPKQRVFAARRVHYPSTTQTHAETSHLTNKSFHIVCTTSGARAAPKSVCKRCWSRRTVLTQATCSKMRPDSADSREKQAACSQKRIL